MNYRMIQHVHFKEDWQRLPLAIREQLKKKLVKVLENPHIPKNRLNGELASCYKIKLLKAGVRLIYQVSDEDVVILLVTVGKREDRAAYETAIQRVTH